MNDYLNTGTRKNATKSEALNSGKDIILTSDAAIEKYILSSIHGEQHSGVVGYGKVNQRLAEDVDNYSEGKIIIKDGYLELSADDLKHSYDEHLKAKQDGDVDLSETDFLNIPEYLDNYDELLYAIKYKSGYHIYELRKILQMVKCLSLK